MHKAVAYKALMHELERWRTLPWQEIVACVGKRFAAERVRIDGEEIEIDISLQWSDAERSSVRIAGTANGPSHWRLERLEESIVRTQ